MATAVMAGQSVEMLSGSAPARQMAPQPAVVRRNPRMSLAQHNALVFETQRKARRGPTPEVFFSKHLDNTRIVKADDPVRRREMKQFTTVMSVLFCLVMVYVWQHFAAIEMGYHVETQKTQLEQLREENRQLRLAEAQLTEPERIDTLAKQLGLSVPAPGQVVRPDGMAMGPNAPVLAEAGPIALR